MEESKNKKVTLQGGDDMSDYNNCDIEILMSKEEFLDWSIYTEPEQWDDYPIWLVDLGPGGVLELTEHFSKEECVLVIRHEIFDDEKKIYYESIELETINTPKEKYKELNKTYHKKAYNNYPNTTEYNIMNEKEIEDFKNEYEDLPEVRNYGYDIYTIENFDLDLELKTGYS